VASTEVLTQPPAIAPNANNSLTYQNLMKSVQPVLKAGKRVQLFVNGIRHSANHNTRKSLEDQSKPVAKVCKRYKAIETPTRGHNILDLMITNNPSKIAKSR